MNLNSSVSHERSTQTARYPDVPMHISSGRECGAVVIVYLRIGVVGGRGLLLLLPDREGEGDGQVLMFGGRRHRATNSPECLGESIEGSTHSTINPSDLDMSSLV